MKLSRNASRFDVVDEYGTYFLRHGKRDGTGTYLTDTYEGEPAWTSTCRR